MDSPGYGYTVLHVQPDRMHSARVPSSYVSLLPTEVNSSRYFTRRERVILANCT